MNSCLNLLIFEYLGVFTIEAPRIKRDMRRAAGYDELVK